jgi:hypothetical protein
MNQNVAPATAAAFREERPRHERGNGTAAARTAAALILIEGVSARSPSGYLSCAG